MKKLILIIGALAFALLPVLVAVGPQAHHAAIARKKAASGGGSPTLWIDEIDGNSEDDWNGIGDSTSHTVQQINVDQTRDVDQVRILLRKTGANPTCHIEIWDNRDRGDGGASQIGGDSDQQTITTTSNAEYTFTWSTRPTITTTGDVFIHVLHEDVGGNIRVPVMSDDAAPIGEQYETASFAAGNQFSSYFSGADDFIFEVWTVIP